MSSLRSAPLGTEERARLPQVATAALVLAIALWSAVVIAAFLDKLTLPGSSRTYEALLAAPPVALGLAWLVSKRPAGLAIRALTGFSAVLALVLWLVPQVIATPTILEAIVAVTAVAWLVYWRPAVGAVAVLAVTASFGSLTAYLSWPYNKTLTLILASLWAAAIIRIMARRREVTLRVPLGIALIIAYLVISAAQVVLPAQPHVALGGFELAPWFMMTLLVVGYSQWPLQTHGRIVLGALVICVCVGAYATLRLVVGPSAAERSLASESTFNFVNGKLKLTGSFPNGADLAEWTALMIPFCVSCALGFSRRTRVVACIAIPLLLIGLFGSQVRAPAVAVVIAVLLTIVLHGFARAFRGARIGRAAVALLLTIGLVTGAYLVAGSSSQNTGHSYLALLSGNAHDASVSQHEYKWGEAFHDLSGHPFGYGLGTAPAGYTAKARPSRYILPVTGFSVDNGYLKIALEQGAAVMIVFAAALALLALALARSGVSTRDGARATLMIAAAGTAVSLFILEGAGAFADGIPAIAAWLVIGLGVAQLVSSPRPPQAASGPPGASALGPQDSYAYE